MQVSALIMSARVLISHQRDDCSVHVKNIGLITPYLRVFGMHD